MKIAISVGHGQYIRGASASPRPPMLDEVNEAIKFVDRFYELLMSAGVGCVKFFDTTSTTQNQNLSTICAWHNAQSRDYDVSCHFNSANFNGATTSKPVGTEVFHHPSNSSTQKLASDVSYAMAKAGGFINRGAKPGNLTFLQNTNKPAILLEVCFVNSSADGNLWRTNFEAIVRAAAEAITKVSIGTEPPVEPPEPETPPPDAVTARVDITIKATGNVMVSVNGQDMMINEGPETPSTPVFPPNQQNIICTVFGGSSDPNNSAYPPYDFITNTERSVALPARFSSDDLPRVRVFNTANELSVLCDIRDIGPWYTDDPYWISGTRPRAEPEGSTIIGGPNDGKKSNGAGIDLTPAAAKAIGIEGKGIVHWAFEEEIPVA